MSGSETMDTTLDADDTDSTSEIDSRASRRKIQSKLIRSDNGTLNFSKLKAGCGRTPSTSTSNETENLGMAID